MLSEYRSNVWGLCTMIIRPRPVVDFLLGNQNVNHPNQIKWDKVNHEAKRCRCRLPVEITVHVFFVNHRHTELECCADYPYINVGKPIRPTFIPVEIFACGKIKAAKLRVMCHKSAIMIMESILGKLIMWGFANLSSYVVLLIIRELILDFY